MRHSIGWVGTLLLLTTHNVVLADASASPSAPATATAKTTAPAAAAPAGAAPKKAPAKSVAQERLDAAVNKLKAGDPNVVEAGFAALAEQGGAAAERALTERIAQGLPPNLIAPALHALVAMNAKRSLPVVLELLEHRRALVRSEALLAIAALDARKPSPLQPTFIALLNDPASEVSDAAAQGLGRFGTKAALPALFAAYDKGSAAALASIAKLAGPESLPLVLERAKSRGVTAVAPVLDGMLARNALPSAGQIKLARALTESGGDDARQYLLQWLDRIKLAQNAQVKKHLFEALKAFNAPAATPAPAPAAPVPATPAAPAAPQQVAAKGAVQ
jgi:hypothetical protein